MAFLNIPVKAIGAIILDYSGYETMPWYDPTFYPVGPGGQPPLPVDRDYRWKVTLEISPQFHSSYISRSPGVYNGMDISVGQWVASTATGQAWQIVSIEQKTESQVVAIIQDVYRYNTFRDPSSTGSGAPPLGAAVVFNLSEEGIPQIDPVPPSGVSAQFSQNLNSRFEYINIQYDYPLYQESNSFKIGDVVAVNPETNSYVIASTAQQLVVGRVTSVSDTRPGWFTVNPVQKIVDFLDHLPGNVGDIIYTSTTVPGELTTDPGGAKIYVKLRNDSPTTVIGTLPGPTNPGNVMQINGKNAEINGSGTVADAITAVNLVSNDTGITASPALAPTSVETNLAYITSTYGEPALFSANAPAIAEINSVLVTFDLSSPDPGYQNYARPAQMAESINSANIPNIVASVPGAGILRITNTAGGPITIVNVIDDVNGVPVAGPNSGTGLELLTPASTVELLSLSATDSRPINLLDVIGTPIADFGLVSAENGTKAAGMYIKDGIRTASSTVVADLAQLNSLDPLTGDTAFVIDSADSEGNHSGEWSFWLYNGSQWVQTANQDSSTTDAKSLETTLYHNSLPETIIGEVSTGRRIALITIEVITPFDSTPNVSIGYVVNNPTNPVGSIDGLMSTNVIDLTTAGIYTASTSVLFGIDTPEGDVDIMAYFNANGSTTGEVQIIVSYM